MERQKYCTIYIVRHGQTESNVNNIVDGHFNAPLTAEGRQQAKNIKEKFKDIHFAAAFSSDLIRARDTAETIIEDRQLALNTTQMLRERYFGVYEGKSAEEYNRDNQAMFEKLQTLNEQEKRKFKVYDTMESEEEMVSRFITKLREIAVAYLENNVLVVAHGSIMRTFLFHLGVGSRQDFGPGTLLNTAYIELDCDGVDFFIKNVVGHNKNNTTDKFYS